MGIVGIFATLEGANRAVLLCQQEFMEEFDVRKATSDDEFDGFCYEDRGPGQPTRAGTSVGMYWEFDDGASWYSCGIEAFQVIG